jgi:predicted ATP-grasp superfamily ATP-dependent carboligase
MITPGGLMSGHYTQIGWAARQESLMSETDALPASVSPAPRPPAPATACPAPAVPSAEPSPDTYDILVLDAVSRQSLATARSLGRAGLRVAMGECFAECDPSLPVLAFRSRYSARNVVLPSYAADATAFAAAVVGFVRDHPTRVVLPASDGVITSLMPVRDRLTELGCLLALPSNAALEIANDKDRTLETARKLGIDHPKTMRIDSIDGLPTLLAEFTFPFVLKPTTGWAQRSTYRLQATEVIDEAEATSVITTYLRAGAGVLAQEWAGGRREGVSMFLVDGDVRASFAHLELRTSPALGGASVLRESVPMPADIYALSVRLATAMGLQGLCEVEFRRDAGNRPLLMEVNARLAGPIEIALLAGVDFPLMIWQWATGLPVVGADGYKTGFRMRWLRGDMRWLRDNYRRAGRPDSMSRTRALWSFAWEFARTVRYDCFDWRDLRPVIAELHTTAAAVRRGPRATRDLTGAAADPHPRRDPYVR